MHDLRKKAMLESQKTVSRKARSKPDDSPRSAANLSPGGSPSNSRAGSRANSRPNSRPGSRYASEAEANTDSEHDDVTISTNSASDDEDDESSSPWLDRLQVRVKELLDRKRNLADREETLRAYIHLLRHHFAQDGIEDSVSEIYSALLKGARSGGSRTERLLAIRSLALTMLTCRSETIFGHVYEPLKQVCDNADEEDIMTEAIYALGIATTYGGGDESDGGKFLDYLFEIVESDGEYVGAHDNGAVVAAAIQVWAFVATHLSDVTDRTESAIEAFLEQLDSTNAEVQTNAGSAIALLFENHRESEEAAGETPTSEYNKHRINTRISEIVKSSSKSVSKKNRKDLRAHFLSIVTSLERGVGPGYSTAGRPAENPHDASGGPSDEFHEFGYRDKIRVRYWILTIDTWLAHTRVAVAKTILGGGWTTHYLENATVREMLEPVDLTMAPGSGQIPLPKVF